MRKSHRGFGSFSKSPKQSSKNPYHSFAEGGEVPGTDQNDKNLGRSKKVSSAAEDVYRGGANAKRLNTSMPNNNSMGRTQKVNSIAEGMYQGKANAKRFADGGMPGYDNQAQNPQVTQPQPQVAQAQVAPGIASPRLGMAGRPQMGYGRPGDPSMYNGGGIRAINTSAMTQQPQQCQQAPIQRQQAQIQSAKCGKLIQNFHHRSPKR